MHIGLEALVTFVQDEILEDADRRDIKIGGAIGDEHLKLILHLGSEHDIGTHQHFEKNDANTVSVLDMLGFGSLALLFTHIVSIWVEDRGDVGLISTDWSNVEYISKVEL